MQKVDSPVCVGPWSSFVLGRFCILGLAAYLTPCLRRRATRRHNNGQSRRSCFETIHNVPFPRPIAHGRSPLLAIPIPYPRPAPPSVRLDADSDAGPCHVKYHSARHWRCWVCEGWRCRVVQGCCGLCEVVNVMGVGEGSRHGDGRVR